MQVFISYSRVDQEVVDNLVDVLQRAGHNLWSDHQQIMGGEDWQRAIATAIQDAEVFISIITSVDLPEFKRQEFTYAEEAGTEIILYLPTQQITVEGISSRYQTARSPEEVMIIMSGLERQQNMSKAAPSKKKRPNNLPIQQQQVMQKAAPPIQQQVGCTATVEVDAANVRVEPRNGTSLVGILRSGDELLVHARSDRDSGGFEWFQVTVLANNIRGWIRGDLVSITGDCADVDVIPNMVNIPEASNMQQQVIPDFDNLNIGSNNLNIPQQQTFQQEEVQQEIEDFEPAQQSISIREELEITTRALSDLPTTEDWLNFSDYAQALSDFIKNENTAKPLTIGIDAAWGMGKTSLMYMIQKELNRDEEGEERKEKFPTVWFNAWKYDQEESLWAALALEILLQVRKQMSFMERQRFNLDLAWKRMDKGKAITLFAKTVSIYVATIVLGLIVLGLTGFAADVPDIFAEYGRAVFSLGLIPPALSLGKEIRQYFTGATDFNIGQYINKPNYRERVGFLAEFEEDFSRVVKVVTKDGRWPLVVFIDDLDRCAPPRATEIVEAINVLLDSEHCVFILGMDAQTVAASIEAKYKDIKEFIDEADYLIGMSLGQRFLEKIVQISFHIPRADPDLMSDFVNRSLAAGKNDKDSDGRREAGESVPVEVQEAEELIQAEQRAGKTLNEAVQAVRQQAPNLSATVVQQAQQEVFAKSFDDSEEVQQAIHEMVRYLGFNPRRVKRFINVFRLQSLIANRRDLLEGGQIDLRLLAKWVVIITRWPDISEAMQTDGEFMARLKETSQMGATLKADDNAPKAKKMTDNNRQDMQQLYDGHMLDERIARLLVVNDLLRLLDNISEDDANTLRTYFYLTELAATAT